MAEDTPSILNFLNQLSNWSDLKDSGINCTEKQYRAIRNHLEYMVDIQPSPLLMANGQFDEYRTQVIDILAKQIANSPDFIRQFILSNSIVFCVGDDPEYTGYAFSNTFHHNHTPKSLSECKARGTHQHIVHSSHITLQLPFSPSIGQRAVFSHVFKHEVSHAIDALLPRAAQKQSSYLSYNLPDGFLLFSDMLASLQHIFDYPGLEETPHAELLQSAVTQGDAASRKQLLRDAGNRALKVLYANEPDALAIAERSNKTSPAAFTLADIYLPNSWDSEKKEFTPPPKKMDVAKRKFELLQKDYPNNPGEWDVQMKQMYPEQWQYMQQNERDIVTRNHTVKVEAFAETMRHYWILHEHTDLPPAEINDRLRAFSPQIWDFIATEALPQLFTRSGDAPLAENQLKRMQAERYGQMLPIPNTPQEQLNRSEAFTNLPPISRTRAISERYLEKVEKLKAEQTGKVQPPPFHTIHVDSAQESPLCTPPEQQRS